MEVGSFYFVAACSEGYRPKEDRLMQSKFARPEPVAVHTSAFQFGGRDLGSQGDPPEPVGFFRTLHRKNDFPTSLWAQTDLEFSPLRPGQGRVLPVPGVSLGSDRFRIFSAQAKGAFQCHEISPRVRFALEQSGESRCRLGTLSGRLFGVRPIRVSLRLFGVRPISSLWGPSLWGQTDLEFSPLRPRARSSARRSRLAFDSLWSRAANRADRLGTLSGRERPRIGTSSARVASVWCFAR